MCLDEQPDGDPHGECAAEIKHLTDALQWAQESRDKGWALAKNLQHQVELQSALIDALYTYGPADTRTFAAEDRLRKFMQGDD